MSHDDRLDMKKLRADVAEARAAEVVRLFGVFKAQLARLFGREASHTRA